MKKIFTWWLEVITPETESDAIKSKANRVRSPQKIVKNFLDQEITAYSDWVIFETLSFQAKKKFS